MATSVSSVTSHFPDAENGFTTTTSGAVTAGATTVGLNSVAGYTNGEPVVFVIDPSNAKKQTFTGIIDTSGSQVTGVVWTAGTNVDHLAGATVIDTPTATHVAMISKGIKVSLDQDGTLKAGAVDNAAVLASNVVTTAKILDANVTNAKLASDISPAKFANPYKFAAYMAAAANTGNNDFAAIAFDTERYDTGSNHSAGVFTAPVAGFYQFNWNAEATLSAGASESFTTALFKNGSVLVRGSLLTHPGTASSTLQGSHGSALVQLAASDTVDIRAFAPATRALNVSSTDRTWWDGHLVSAT